MPHRGCPTTPPYTDTMRQRAWYDHGVAFLLVAYIADPWLRQAVPNEATRRRGSRNGGNRYASKRKRTPPAG